MSPEHSSPVDYPQQVTKGKSMKQLERFHQPRANVKFDWKRYIIDSLLSLAGVALVTGILVATHLYPKIPAVLLLYLLIIVGVASTRSHYAAILASLLSVFAYDYFLLPPTYLLALVVFLTIAIIIGQFTSALRHSAQEARSREREMRLLYEKAQQLAALQERQRLARELHDSVSQAIYAIGLSASTAYEALASNDPKQAETSIEYVLTLAEAGLAEMRALIFELRPESLESEGLVAALNRQVAVLRTRYRLTVEANLDNEPDLSLEKKEALYRIAQEALHNIVKHAHATTVVLELTGQDHIVTLEVEDNGKGFDPAQSFPGHLGLRSMRERAAKVGATLDIKSTPGQGTQVQVQVPETLLAR